MSLSPENTSGEPRSEVARYVMLNAAKVRAIARRKLTGRTRQVFDSEEVLSSVLRRLDTMAQRGTLRPRSDAELWGLVEAIATNTAVSKTRLIERSRNLVTEDGPYAYELLKRLNACTDDDEATLLVLRMTASLKDPLDRQVLTMVLRGASHKAIAAMLGTSVDASRQRWMRIRRELAERFGAGELDG